MKIAILTQPLKSNFGCILQAYALQTVLMRMGHTVEVIKREYPRAPLKVRLKRILRFLHTLYCKYVKGKKYLVLSNPLSEEYTYLPKSKVYDFTDEYINLSQSIYTTESLTNYFIEHAFDACIVGSDQVWRPRYSPCITNYFLDCIPFNIKTRRIAYAASFGTSDWEFTPYETDVCAKLAAKFIAISVREDSGVCLCKENLGVEAKLVFDPTMLLLSEDYEKLIQNKRVVNHGESLACYFLDETKEKSLLVSEIAEYLNIKPYYLATRVIDDSYNNLTVEEWLDGISKAKYVVVDSFHGCVFSILFKKQFVVIGNHQRGLSRFKSLLSNLGLASRMVTSLDEFMKRKQALMAPIDYDSIEKRIVEIRNNSLAFLYNALN